MWLVVNQCRGGKVVRSGKSRRQQHMVARSAMTSTGVPQWHGEAVSVTKLCPCMSLNRRKNRQSVGWSSEMERGGCWRPIPRSLISEKSSRGCPLPLSVGGVGVLVCAPTNVHKVKTHPAKPARVGQPHRSNPLTPLVTLVFPPSRFLWHVHPPPRYTCCRGGDSCACPKPHRLCGPRKVFENQGTRQTSRAPVRSSANPSQPAPRIPETK